MPAPHPLNQTPILILLLSRQVFRARENLAIVKNQPMRDLQDYQAGVEIAEEMVATAEMLLLIAQEREALWRQAQAALQTTPPTTAETLVPAQPIPDAKKS